MELLGQIGEAVVIEKESMPVETKSRIRELMTIVMAASLSVEEITVLENDVDGGTEYTGFVEFSIATENMGLNSNIMRKYQREIYTSLFVDFIAGLIVRENMDAFLKEMAKISMSDYPDVIGNRKHQIAGMCQKGNYMVFSFHLSMLQDILVSDFKKKI